MQRDTLLELLENAIAQVNTTLAPEKQIPAAAGTVLTGADSALDSLTLTTLFFEIEARASAETGASIDLFGAPFLLDPDHSLTVNDLAFWLSEQLAA